MPITVLLLIAHQGYQPIEYGTPKQILESAGIVVKTVSNTAGTAVATDGSKTNVDFTIDQINDITNYAGLFLIGGGGALENLDNPHVYKLVQKFAHAHKPFGAICISPRILAKAGVLTGKKATGWDEDHELDKIFAQHGVTYEHKPVVTDGNIVTATGPRAAQEFGKAIVTVVK